MDASKLASLTAAVCLLASECVKGIASAAGKDTWKQIKKLLGFSDEPEMAGLAETVAERLGKHADKAARICELLQKANLVDSHASLQLINVKADDLVVAITLNAGTFNM